MTTKAVLLLFHTGLFTLIGLSTAETLMAAPENKNKERKTMPQEEKQDYYWKWLSEDVLYIITSEEQAVFKNLTTPAEKEQFIEQFWRRRDPDVRTAVNELREEHYRRIAYANERFASGKPGWMTDRGRIYIIHGPPAEIEAYPSGGTYQRPFYEGGGTTVTYPFEIWRYRHIEGIGQDVELEFVDPSFSGEYRMALRPEEKDALLRVAGVGLTLGERLGLAGKRDRPYFSPGNRQSYPFVFQRAADNPFQRYETYVGVQRPPEIKYKDLKEIVTTNVSYPSLPFEIRQDYFRLGEGQVLVPITLELQNQELTFKEENGVHNAKVAVYGVITSITNRLIHEFDDDLLTSYRPQSWQRGLSGRSIYQKMVWLDRKMRYKLDLVVKDLHSGKTGVIRQAIVPPHYGGDKLCVSSLILSDFAYSLAEVPSHQEMFVLGDIKIRPSVRKVFSVASPLAVYFQLYNVGIDQTSLRPSLQVSYTVLRSGEPVVEVIDEEGESVQFFSDQRVVLIRKLPVESLESGDYRVKVTVRDEITNQVVTVRDNFQILRPSIQRVAH